MGLVAWGKIVIMDGGRVDIYDLLISENIVGQANLEQALHISQDENIPLYTVLIDRELAEEEVVLRFLGNKFNIPFELIDRNTIDFKVASTITESFARENLVLPLFHFDNTLTVAISNPFNLHIIEELAMITGYTINPILTTKTSIESLLSYCYSNTTTTDETEPSQMAALFEMGMKLIGDSGTNEETIYDLAQEAPIAKLVDTILRQAIDEKASDIHIEPEEKALKIRLRVDGLLRDVMLPPKKLEPAIISRLKILSNLDITEKRKPQDGRMNIVIKDKEIDFRVSTVRTIYGEKMVLRILDKAGSYVSVDKLGLESRDEHVFSSLINNTTGVVIVCGPTGSGKTSTLYSALAQIKSPEKNIITIEDPVEYSLEGINQIPVNTKIGMDFATGLSAIVRQDPDVIMVGEIRDLETASIAIQAALTGHMVFTTLHTRNAPGALTRLIDMGIQPFLLTSAIAGIIAQRLVRRICPHCRKSIKLNQLKTTKETEMLTKFQADLTNDIRIFHGEGCKYCDNTGYKGRLGIFEILVMDEETRSLTVQKASTEKIMEAAQANGMTSMQTDGFQKVLKGDTTLEELARVLDI